MKFWAQTANPPAETGVFFWDRPRPRPPRTRLGRDGAAIGARFGLQGGAGGAEGAEEDQWAGMKWTKRTMEALIEGPSSFGEELHDWSFLFPICQSTPLRSTSCPKKDLFFATPVTVPHRSDRLQASELQKGVAERSKAGGI